MAVLGRLLLGSAERLDLPDLLSIDSFAAADFKYLIQSFVGSDKPFILKGFEIIQPQDSIDTESVSIRVADSVMYYPAAGAGSFYFGLPEGTTGTEALVPELRKNATNFIYLTLSTSDTARDSRAFWDPDQNGGDGGEFSQDVNTQTVLSVEVGVSVSSFPQGVVPIARVKVGPSIIESIQDCRDMMFRLGSGGVNPDPFNTFDFRDDPNSTYSRSEPSTLMGSALDPNPFEGGDKNIYTLKEWMDVVMTRIKEISGEQYWYSQGSGSGLGQNLSSTWYDALGSSLISKGTFFHDELIGGRITWDEPVTYKNLTDPRSVIVRPSTIDLTDNNQVAYVQLIRDQDINTTSTAVDWINGANYVNGVVGSFENLSKGDWIKKKLDDRTLYLRAEEFYAGLGLTGGTTSPALASSVRLSANYAGTTATELADYTKGEYLQTDIIVEDIGSQATYDAGGDFYWLSNRIDVVCDIESITPTEITIDITQADGVRARVTSVGHGLIDQDRVTVTTGGYAGTYQVEVEDADNFFIDTAITGDELGQTAFYAIVETRAVSTEFGYELESENHTAKANQRIFIEDTGSLYDGSYLCNPRSDTTLQIPYNADTPDPATATDTGQRLRVIKVNVKTEFGVVKVIQGESVDIGDIDSQNILSYIGMDSLSQTKPIYNVPNDYNALDGFQNYNSDEEDDLTTRAAKLTSMMADRVQERGFSLRGRVNITSVTNGGDQDISANGSLTLHKPSSPEQIIDLTCSLPINSVAIANIDRDGGAGITLTVESIGNDFLLGENKYIMFYRFSDTTVYTWDDQELRPNGHINFGLTEDSSNRNIVVYNPGQLKLDAITGLLTLQVSEGPEQTRIVVADGATTPQSSWLTLNAALDTTEYYVWYNVDAGGTDPAVAGKTAIPVAISSGDTADDVAIATETAINLVAGADMTAVATGDEVEITNLVIGEATNCLDLGSTGFNITILCEGNDPDIELLIPGSTDRNIIDVDVINGLGTLIVPDGAAAWVRVNRFALKTFNTVLTADAPDTDANGAIYITNIEDVPVDQDVFVLWTRMQASMIESNKAQRTDGNVYEEYLDVIAGPLPANAYEIVGPLPSGTELQLPPDSRDGGNTQEYVVGSGQLELHLRGAKLRNGIDFEEVGVAGCLSSRIKILRPLVISDSLFWSIRTEGAVYFASDGVSATSLQDAYDNGRFINITTGQPIVITGASGKLVSIQGDMDVTGVIDPKGITFDLQGASPFTAQSGIWFNSADEMIIEAVAGNSVINSAAGDLSLKSATGKIISSQLEMTGQIDLNGNLLTDGAGPLTIGSNLDLNDNELLNSLGNITIGSNIDLNGSYIVDGPSVFLHSSGTDNLFTGLAAGNTSLTGAQNTGIGANALNALTSGADNTSIGYNAGALLEDGASNTAIGSESLQSQTSASNNTAVGHASGASITSGENSVFIGSGADTSADTLDNQIAIGSGAIVDAANKARIGNDNVTTFELAPNSTLQAASGTLSIQSIGDLSLDSSGGDVGITGSNLDIIGSTSLDLAGGTSTLAATDASVVITSTLISLVGLFQTSAAASIGGTLNMNNSRIANLSAPTASGDAARKQDVDDLASTISGDFLKLDGTSAMEAAIDMDSFKILNLGTPTLSTDAATKGYVDTTIGNLTAADIAYVNTTSGLTATDVQDAIDEVEQTQSTHISASSAHGVAGDIVGTTDAQTLSGKTISELKYDEADVALASSIARSTATIMHLTGTATDLQAMTGGADGEVRILINETNDSFSIIEDAGADGFYTGSGIDLNLEVNGSVQAIYDATAARWRLIGGSGSGSGGTSVKVSMYDPLSSALPTGTSATIDGQALANGDRVLFSNLSSGNNRIYEASGVGVSISWQALKLFEGNSETPVDGDAVVVAKGDTFADQKVFFNGTDFRVNDVVRFFDGANGTDYWELSSIKTSTLTDNTTNGVVFDVSVAGSENWIIEYSLTRGAGIKETGQLILTSDGSDVAITKTNGFLGASGVEFNADINSGDIRLLYTTSNTGSNATMKYITKRWSNATGGPGGVPNYSGFTGSSTTAAGAIGDIQFHGGTGNLDGNSAFKWDSTEEAVNLGGLYIHKLQGPEILLDNTSNGVIFSVDAANFRHAVIEYSLDRDGDFQTGRMMLVNNGTTISFVSDDFVATTGSLGIAFDSDISGSNVRLLYNSTSTGNNASFKYNIRNWS